MNREQLVFRMAGTGECPAAGDHHVLPADHRATAIENESDRNRDVCIAEELNLLGLIVLKHTKGTLREIGHGVRPPVEDIDVQDDEVRLRLEDLKVLRVFV